MTTQWDDERVLARVEAREPGNAGQQDIGATVGYVVRLYDRGPLDGRLGEHRIIFDSEVTHGGLGVFGSEDEAAGFRDRRKDAQLAGARSREVMRAEREHALPELSAVCVEQRAKAKREASEASARGRAALERQDALAAEAKSPLVVIECPPNGSGWSVSAGVCVTEGDGEPRRLAEVLPDEAERARPRKKKAAKKGKKKKELAPSVDDAISRTLAAQPTSVPDCAGLPLQVGAKVLHVADEFEAELEDIRYQDKSGAWAVTIVDQVGAPFECLSSELKRVEVKAEEPELEEEDWPV